MNDSSAPSTVRWRILALLLAFSFMSWFNRVSMPVAYNVRIKDQLGISEKAIGSVYSALLFAYMLCMTPGGWFADRWGPRLALAVMGLGSALFVILTGMVGLALVSAGTVVVLLLIVRALMGLFTAPIYPASGRILAHWMPVRQRAAANGTVMAAALVGNACTYIGFGALVDRFDWPAAFAITGTITGLLALVWVWYGRNDPVEHPAVNEAEQALIGTGPKPREQPAAEPGQWRVLLRNHSLVLLTVSYAAIGYFEYLFYFWMHYYFDEQLKVGKDESRLYATIISLTTAAGMLLGGWLSDRLARARGQRFARTAVVVSGMVLAAALLGAGVLVREVGWVVVCFALANAAIGLTEGPAWATAIELGGRQGATAAGIFNTGGNAGGVLSPIVTPVVSDYLGWQWGIGLGGLVCLAGACLWWWIDPGEGEREPNGM
jgi:sugar phosphate permease